MLEITKWEQPGDEETKERFSARRRRIAIVNCEL
jgi:hypothetical protein